MLCKQLKNSFIYWKRSLSLIFRYKSLRNWCNRITSIRIYSECVLMCSRCGQHSLLYNVFRCSLHLLLFCSLSLSLSFLFSLLLLGKSPTFRLQQSLHTLIDHAIYLPNHDMNYTFAYFWNYFFCIIWWTLFFSHNKLF
jgi:hypothetical protein